jgi:nitroreductase
MEALEAIGTRRVVRAYSDKPVALEDLKKIIDAGRHAMSARNLQPWQFVVIRDRARLREIGALCSTGRYVADAPAAIVVLKDRTNTRWADVDCAHAVQNMANAAWAMGLGTCWVGNFDAQKLSAILSSPQDWPVFTVLPFGYPNSASPPQSKQLKARADTMHYERWGGRTD